MSKMLYSIKWKGEKPTVEDVAEKFGFEKEDIDEDFGVIEVDPKENLYSILVEETALGQKANQEIEGPFSNPKIEPFDLK